MEVNIHKTKHYLWSKYGVMHCTMQQVLKRTNAAKCLFRRYGIRFSDKSSPPCHYVRLAPTLAQYTIDSHYSHRQMKVLFDRHEKRFLWQDILKKWSPMLQTLAWGTTPASTKVAFTINNNFHLIMDTFNINIIFYNQHSTAVEQNASTSSVITSLSYFHITFNIIELLFKSATFNYQSVVWLSYIYHSVLSYCLTISHIALSYGSTLSPINLSHDWTSSQISEHFPHHLYKQLNHFFYHIIRL